MAEIDTEVTTEVENEVGKYYLIADVTSVVAGFDLDSEKMETFEIVSLAAGRRTVVSYSERITQGG